jgi:hypothetical protein
MSDIIALVTTLLVPSAGEPLALAPDAEPRLAEELRRYYGSVHLVDVVEQLALFATWLGGERQSPSARDRLLAIAHTAIPEIERLGLVARLATDSA